MIRFNEWIKSTNQDTLFLNEARVEMTQNGGTTYAIVDPIEQNINLQNIPEWKPYSNNYTLVKKEEWVFSSDEIKDIIEETKVLKKDSYYAKYVPDLYNEIISNNYDFNKTNDFLSSYASGAIAYKNSYGIFFRGGSASKDYSMLQGMMLIKHHTKGWNYFGPIAYGYVPGWNYAVFVVKSNSGGEGWEKPTGQEEKKTDGEQKKTEGEKIDKDKTPQDKLPDIKNPNWKKEPAPAPVPAPAPMSEEEKRKRAEEERKRRGRKVDPKTGTLPPKNTEEKPDGFFGQPPKEDPLIAKYKDYDIRNSDSLIEKRVGDLFSQNNMRVYYDRANKVIVVKKLEPVGNPMAPEGFSLKDAGPGGSMIRIIPQNDQNTGLYKALMQAYEQTHNNQPIPQIISNNMWSGRKKTNGQPIEHSDDIVILNRPFYRGETLQKDYPDKYVIFQSGGPYDPNTGELDKRQSNVGMIPAPYYTNKATGQKVYYPSARGYTGKI